jgi:hypothetical protein
MQGRAWLEAGDAEQHSVSFNRSGSCSTAATWPQAAPASKRRWSSANQASGKRRRRSGRL